LIVKNSPLVLANSKTRWNSNCHLAPLGFVNRESSAIYLPIISAHFKGAGKVLFELCIKYTSRYVCNWIRICVCHIMPTSVSNTFQLRVHFWLLNPLNFHKPYIILWYVQEDKPHFWIKPMKDPRDNLHETSEPRNINPLFCHIKLCLANIVCGIIENGLVSGMGRALVTPIYYIFVHHCSMSWSLWSKNDVRESRIISMNRCEWFDLDSVIYTYQKIVRLSAVPRDRRVKYISSHTKRSW